MSKTKLMILATTALVSFGGSLSAEEAHLSVNADSKAVENLNKDTKTTISGIVKEVKNEKKFILQDSRGDTIDINTNSKHAVKTGDKVTVHGDVRAEALNMGKEIDNAAVSTVGIDLDKKEGHDISVYTDQGSEKVALVKNLPEKGDVQISGKVKDVKDKDSFTLEDNTGDTINVDANKNVSLVPGDSVTVYGRVESKALGLGEQIKATKVSKL